MRRSLFFSDSAPPFFPQTKSVSFNESGAGNESMSSVVIEPEYLGASVLEIENAWTFSIWFKPGPFSLTQTKTLFELDPNANEIRIELRGASTNDPLSVTITTPLSIVIKEFAWNSIYTSGVWLFLVVTWNGTDMLAYFNAVETAPTTKATDSAGSMGDDAARGVIIGDFNNSNQGADAVVHSIGLWSSVLTGSEITALYNGGNGKDVDWANDGGNYTSSIDLKHWWRLAFDTTSVITMGNDYGKATVLVNVGTYAVNIDTVGDVVTDAPGS